MDLDFVPSSNNNLNVGTFFLVGLDLILGEKKPFLIRKSNLTGRQDSNYLIMDNFVDGLPTKMR